MKISSRAFINNGRIPEKYTCKGDGVNPPLTFSEIPEGCQSLLLIMNDPDAVSGNFLHWLVWSIPPNTTEVTEGKGIYNGREGVNGAGKVGYIGPCPPSGTHRYIFTLYALDNVVDLPVGVKLEQIPEIIKPNVIDSAELIGVFGNNF